MRPHESESYSLVAKPLFVWPYPYNKSFWAFLFNRYCVEVVLFIGHFPCNHIIIDDSDHWLNFEAALLLVFMYI